MGGGHFEYNCFRISQFAEDLQHAIDVNSSNEQIDDFGTLLLGRHFGDDVLVALKESQAIIEKAGVLAKEIEWLYSGDHGEDSFLRLVQPILRRGK